MSKKIFIVTYGGGHARMLRPVIEELLKGNHTIQILALTTAKKELEDLDVEILGYRDFFSKLEKVQEYGSELASTLEKVVNYKETVSYLGANFLELINTHGESVARKLYNNGGRYIFEPINTMEFILKAISPDLVITTNSPRSEKCVVLAARKLGIKSVAFINMFGIRSSSWVKSNSFADKIFVLSGSVKKYLVSLGRNEKDILVTGNPGFDSLVLSYQNNIAKITKRREVSPFTVLWASQPEPAFVAETRTRGNPLLPVQIERVLVDIFNQKTDWLLVARNHPSETVRSYPSFIKTSHHSDSLDELLGGVHVVITPSSSVGFQGIIMGTRLVTLDISALTTTQPYAEMGYSTGLKNLKEIGPTLKSLSDTKNDVFVPPYTINNATLNAVNVINEILS